MFLWRILTELACILSMLGSGFIILTYFKFKELRQFTFLILCHSCAANFLMNLIMLYHLVFKYYNNNSWDVLVNTVPLCSLSTLLYYMCCTSYTLFVSIISFLLYRRVVLKHYTPLSDKTKRALVTFGWFLPLIFVTTPSALPHRFWNDIPNTYNADNSDNFRDGCMALRQALNAFEDASSSSSSNNLESLAAAKSHLEFVHSSVVLRIGIFLMLPSVIGLTMNTLLYIRIQRAYNISKRAAVAQKWMNDVPILSAFEGEAQPHYYYHPIVTKKNDYSYLHQQQKQNKQGYGYNPTAESSMDESDDRGNDDYLPVTDYYSSPGSERIKRTGRTKNKNNNINGSGQFGTSIPIINNTQHSTAIGTHPKNEDQVKRYQFDSLLMDKFSRYPVVCSIFGHFSHILGTYSGLSAFSHTGNLGLSLTGTLNLLIFLTTPTILSRWKDPYNFSKYKDMNHSMMYQEGSQSRDSLKHHDNLKTASVSSSSCLYDENDCYGQTESHISEEKGDDMIGTSSFIEDTILEDQIEYF